MDTDKKLKESKGKWERDRRKRLNDAFERLGKVLPSYDPSINLAKVDIIEQAAIAIQDLNDRLKKSLSNEEDKENTKDEFILKFDARIKKLLLRNELLSKLLKDAGIKVPNSYGTVKKPKWSHRFTPEQAKLLQKKAMEKENICATQPPKSPKKKKTTNNKTKPKTVQKFPAERRRRRTKIGPVANSKCFIIFSQAAPVNNPPLYLVTKKGKVKTNNATQKPAIRPLQVQAGVHQSVLSGNPALPTLGPGTLIFPNGSLVPINQTPIAQPTFITNPIQNNLNPTLIIVSKANSVQPINNNTKIVTQSLIQFNSNKPIVAQLPIVTIPQIFANLNNKQSIIHNQWPRIRPKLCSTNTTQVNKVPIPALTSRYNNYVYINNAKPPTKETTTKSKEVKNKDSLKDQTKNKRKVDGKESHDAKRPKINSKTDKENCKIINIIKVVTTEEQTIAKDSFNSEEKNKSSLTETDQQNTQNIVHNELEKEPQNTEIQNSETKSPETKHSEHKTNEEHKACAETNKLQTSETNVDKGEQTENKTKTSNEVTKSKTKSTTQEESEKESLDTRQNQLDFNLAHSDLSNDIFASLHVPPGCQNPDSTSPTAAFLLAFPLVASGMKVTEVIDGDNNPSSQRETPNLLQIGTMEETKPTQSENLTSNLFNLDNFSFFSHKDSYISSTTSTNFTSVNPASYSNKLGFFDDLFYNQAISSLCHHASSKALPIQPPLSSSITTQAVSSERKPIHSTAGQSGVYQTTTNTQNMTTISASSDLTNNVPNTSKLISVNSGVAIPQSSSDLFSLRKTSAVLNQPYSGSSSIFGDKTTPVLANLQNVPLTHSTPSLTKFSINTVSSLTSENITFPISIYGNTHFNPNRNKTNYDNNPTNDLISSKTNPMTPSNVDFKNSTLKNSKTYSSNNTAVVKTNTSLNDSTKIPDLVNQRHVVNKSSDRNNLKVNDKSKTNVNQETSQHNFGSNVLGAKSYLDNYIHKDSVKKIDVSTITKASSNTQISTTLQQAVCVQNIFDHQRYVENNNPSVVSQEKSFNKTFLHEKENNTTRNIFDFNQSIKPPATIINKMEHNALDSNIFEQGNNTIQELYSMPVEKPNIINSSFNYTPLPVVTNSFLQAKQDTLAKSQKTVLSNSHYHLADAPNDFKMKNKESGSFNFSLFSSDTSKQNQKTSVSQISNNPKDKNYLNPNSNQTSEAQHFNFNPYALDTKNFKPLNNPTFYPNVESQSYNLNFSATNKSANQNFNVNLYSSDAKSSNVSTSKNDQFINQTPNLISEPFNFNSYTIQNQNNKVFESNLCTQTGYSVNQNVKNNSSGIPSQNFDAQNYFSPYPLDSKKKNDNYYIHPGNISKDKSHNNFYPEFDGLKQAKANSNHQQAMQNYNYSLEAKKKLDANNEVKNKNNPSGNFVSNLPNLCLPIEPSSNVKGKNNSLANSNQNHGTQNYSFDPYITNTKKKNDSTIVRNQNESSSNIKVKTDLMNNPAQNQNFHFDPFSFDTKSKIDPNQRQQVYPNKPFEYSNNKKVSCTYTPTVSNFNPYYTNASGYYYDYTSDNNHGNYLKNTTNQGKNYFDYNACSENRNDSGAYCSSLDPYNRDKFASIITTKSKPSAHSKPVNWMTTPQLPQQTSSKDYLLPSFSKDGNNLCTSSFPSSGYFNTCSTTNANIGKKSLDLNYKMKNVDDNQFSWSSSKVPFVDPAHSFVSATLPTLVGDLALNTQVEQKSNKDKVGNSSKDSGRKLDVSYISQNNQHTFLSVSQLVENKEPTPVKVTSRRNSGNRTKNTSLQKPKRVAKSEQNKTEKNDKCVAEKSCNKNTGSSYSAEALISHESKRNKTVIGNFFTDNMVTYFPKIDQDPNFIQQQQSFPHSFTNSFTNTSFTTSSIMSSAASTTYLPTFLNDELYSEGLNAHNPSAKEKPCTKDDGKINIKPDKTSNSSCKKAKKRNATENVLPSFDIPFLSMPGAINSPILPDDFHYTFLPTAAPYKNPLYPKQGADVSGAMLPPLPLPVSTIPDVSSSINNAGTSLTNFNLSTIFPEINKGPSSAYPEKFKDQSTSQASSGNFNKPTFTFSSYET